MALILRYTEFGFRVSDSSKGTVRGIITEFQTSRVVAEYGIANVPEEEEGGG